MTRLGKRIWCAGALLGVLSVPSFAWAEAHEPLHLSPWSVLPFALLLLAIALLPLAAEHFWHQDRNKALVVALLAAPIVVYLVYVQLTTGQNSLAPLLHELGKYLSFVILLGALYTVAGGIVVRGTFAPTPLNNSGLLLAGALLANVIGTTGASVLLIRPLLRMNRDRLHTAHLPVFFIFLVSNLGGCLTPLGDPPLFMGYLHGVPFTWTLGLWPHYLTVVSLVLAVFFVWDWRSFRQETVVNGESKIAEPMGLEGKINLLFLVGIMASVLIEPSWFPSLLAQAWDWFGSGLLMLAMAGLSWHFTPRTLRAANHFHWAPMIEVGILFLGIFITMVPALQLLELHGADFGLTEPWHYFWGTGLLSSMLDNAPTYLAFATTAAGSNDYFLLVDNQIPGLEGPLVLRAISCGAVFMGALSYIGNGPNFMVKAIAEQAGYRPPSFFGYSLYAGVVLGPIFVLVTLLFFVRW